MRYFVIAYCGPAAIPGDHWARWNADPLLIAVLIALVVSSLGLGNPRDLLAYAGLMALGIIVQAQLMRGPKRTEARD